MYVDPLLLPVAIGGWGKLAIPVSVTAPLFTEIDARLRVVESLLQVL